MEETPKISIVTPSYNQGNFLRETIESVLNQNYPNIEYFIVDGGSTDNSIDIIKKYEKHINWWVSEKDKGQSDAINKGFKRSTGELLCWVNSDDVLFPGCLLEVAKNYLFCNKPELIHTNFLYIDWDGCIIRMIRIPRQTRFFMNRGVWSVSSPTSFFSASLLKKVGYLNPEYHLSMDLDLWIRMMNFGARVHYINKYLGAFRWHKDSKNFMAVSSDNKMEISETDKILGYAFPETTIESRWRWRLLWKFYQVANLNYLRSFIETIHVKGKHWKQFYNS